MSSSIKPANPVRRPAAVRFSELRLLARRIAGFVGTLVIIAYLTSFVLIMSERGRLHLPARPLQALWESLGRTFTYFTQHPPTYYWHREMVPAYEMVVELLRNSAGLLLLSLGMATLFGILLGVTAALSRRRIGATLTMLFSVLGVSTPSFLLAMLFWVVNIRVHQTFDVKVLPSAGFGWDAHLIMPALALAMRPLAQIAQVTYVSLADVLRQDYVRTAQAKGLSWRLVRDRHAMRNILIPVLNTIGASLRFSLASLPVIETFFEWPGVGLSLLGAAAVGDGPLVTDLILALGAFFLLVNMAIEVFFPLIDPRLRGEDEEMTEERRSLRTVWREAVAAITSWLRGTRPPRESLPPLPASVDREAERPDRTAAHRRWYLRSFFTNPALLLGLMMVIGLIYLVVAGGTLTEASPYKIHGVMMIDGVIGAPPYAPQPTFPWGTDQVGRDVQALVLYGARQTLALAFFGMLARLALGILLGALAGWWRGSWLDRMVTGAVGVWAAYPITLFAILIIQALGIQQGIWVFVVAISVVGWGEVAQFVRGQVIAIKPQLYIEAARSVGARARQLLSRHVAPNLINPLIVLAALEMGGILMLLAELGFLNIFLGGGFRLNIGEAGGMNAIVVSFSDVPEWSALIASVRLYWRSYPWMALYPGAAFFLSIMAFNLLGDGLRRFLDESQANLSRLFNRYTFGLAVVVISIVGFYLRSSDPLGVYMDEAVTFDTDRAMADIQRLASPEFAGRETDTPGNLAAAEYIAAEMEAAGLLPVLTDGGYIERQVQPRPHLVDIPRLDVLDDQGRTVKTYNYRQDYAELIDLGLWGWGQGPLVALAFGPTPPGGGLDPYDIANQGLDGSIVMIRAEELYYVPREWVAGFLIISDDPLDMQRRNLFYDLYSTYPYGGVPAMIITSEVAGDLLARAGTSLAELDNRRATLGTGEVYRTAAGPTLLLDVRPTEAADRQQAYYYNVIGVLPGTGEMVGLDDDVIIISAYFDGLGIGPDGTFYPSANDNASGVAVLLEIARQLAESPYAPKKTVLFVAWSGGERRNGLSITNLMNLRGGMNTWTVEAVVELSGLGAGSGDGIAIGDESSSRMVQLFQDAARRFGLPTTTRGRDPHYGFYTRPIFGGRNAMTLALSWDGSDQLAHTPMDAFEGIDPRKLELSGRAAYLTILVMARETGY